MAFDVCANDADWTLAEVARQRKLEPLAREILAADPAQQARRAALETQLMAELKQQGDPRMAGHGEIFDNYPYAGKERGLYERYLKGLKLETNWVSPTDAEPAPLDDATPPAAVAPTAKAPKSATPTSTKAVAEPIEFYIEQK